MPPGGPLSPLRLSRPIGDRRRSGDPTPGAGRPPSRGEPNKVSESRLVPCSRRGARAVEWCGLENRRGPKGPPWVRIPPPPLSEADSRPPPLPRPRARRRSGSWRHPPSLSRRTELQIRCRNGIAPSVETPLVSEADNSGASQSTAPPCREMRGLRRDAASESAARAGARRWRCALSQRVVPRKLGAASRPSRDSSALGSGREGQTARSQPNRHRWV